MEEWKNIEGYEGLYQISSYGRVKSVERVVEYIYKGKKRSRFAKEKLLKYGEVKRGYLYVCLWNNGEYKCLFVHKLVAKAFVPNPNDYNVVHHIDHNPKNNRVENLIWMTNEQHYLEHLNERGEAVRNSKSITVYQYTLNRKLVAVWKSASEAAKTLGLEKSAISSCCRGGFYCKSRNKWVNRIQYKGYIWSYKPL